MRKRVLSGLFLLVAGLIFLIPFQASAALTYTMTGYQNLGPLYASGEITGNLTGDLIIAPLYSFCVDNQALLYQNTPYAATLSPIGSNQGLLESAYLIATYAPSNTALTDVNKGVELQWAMWMALGQASPLGSPSTSGSLANTYSSIYTQALQYQSNAQTWYTSASAGDLAQYASMYQELQLQGSQNLLLVQTSTGGNLPTPIPSSIVLLGPGLIALGAVRRRFQM